MTGLRVGTRGSALARTQAAQVADRLRGVVADEVTLVEVVSHGDVTDRPLPEIGGDGVFVGALRQALLAHEVDLAVHSLKDLPTTPCDGIALVAILARDDPRDALVARDRLTLGELPVGARIGTGSPRRAAQLRALGLGVEVVPIRGNVDTRLAKVASGEYDAVVVARAGLARLGRLDEITEDLDPIQMLPAPGQGALAVEVRAGDRSLATRLAVELDDDVTRACVTAERALLRTLEAGCSAPIGALAEYAEADDGPELWLRAVVATPDGGLVTRMSATGDPADPAGLGVRLAEELLADGADLLIAERVS